ncbi:MAG: ATP-binding cassette domain-containing protein [Candidatus Eremiobacteraeota bacterium]|nr:ATP-binding cassette domain-containing protein [Candidatus Eremiobacteraeota bacterium]
MQLTAHADEARRGASIDIRNVVARYPGSDRNAVDDVTLEVEAGEFVVLLGPSGCGKSTLLRTINRLVVPVAGTVAVDGRNIAERTPEELRRGIGYVIQAVGLFPHLTVAQNISVVPRLLHWDRSRIAARVDELLELTQLEPSRYRDRYPRELSGGEQQRVGVARALAAEPRALLMDEPFGAVDAIVRLALQDETLRIHRALGTTIVFVTHDVDEALRLADRIVVMSAGKIEQTDAPLRILARPATAYVEELLDTKNATRQLGLLRARDALRAVQRTTAALDRAAAATAGAPPKGATTANDAGADSITETGATSLDDAGATDETDAGIAAVDVAATSADDARATTVQDAGARCAVNADATLRDVLSSLLQHSSRVAVVDGSTVLGTLSFDDVRNAIAANER